MDNLFVDSAQINKENTIFILGNGASLKDVMYDSKKLDILREYSTFSSNAAYRKYEELNFYPTYFACHDPKLIATHMNEFKRLIHESSIKKFFFLTVLPEGLEFSKEDVSHDKFQKIGWYFKNDRPPSEYYHSTFEKYCYVPSTGANTAIMSMIMGYKNIILLGCDCNYVEFIKECKSINDPKLHELLITETPQTNPNYWFDDYQKKGDTYSIPGTSGHMAAWETVYNASKYHNVNIINISSTSQIPFFKKLTFDEFIKNI